MAEFKLLTLAALAGSLAVCACATQSPPARAVPVAVQATSSASTPPPATAAMATPAASDAHAKELFEGACSGCHDLGTTTQARQSPAQWANTVAVMVSRGAPLDSQQAAEVSGYLARHYGG